jgi:hypothetical protein
MRSAHAVLLATVAISSVALAHGPTRQKVTEQIEIKAAPAKVWDRIKDFNGLPAWHPAIASSAATDGSKIGSVRTLTLKSGGKIVEELEGYDDGTMTIKYRMREGALPVSTYTSTLAVKAGPGGNAIVEWRGAFYRGYPNNDPPPDQNDEAAVKAITDVYQSGLANLKVILEK